jgi:hypothetical protein
MDFYIICTTAGIFDPVSQSLFKLHRRALKLKVDTLSIFFNLQEAVTRNTTKLLELRLSFQTA